MRILVLIFSFCALTISLQAQQSAKSTWKNRKHTKFIKTCERKYKKKYPKKEFTQAVTDYCTCLQEKLEAKNTYRQAKKMPEAVFNTIIADCYKSYQPDTTQTKE